MLTVTAHAEGGEAVAALLHAARTGGVIEEDAPKGWVRLRAYLAGDAARDGALDALRRRLAALPAFGLGPTPPAVEVEEVIEEEWAAAWKAHFHAFPVGTRLWVVPTWEDADIGPPGVAIRLDPGMAFGSGLHPSTQLCLRLLEAYLRPGQRVVDVGTGSGILAIAAAKVGAAGVLAVDIDPVAVQVARRNVVQNGVEDRVTVVEGDLLGPIASPVDLILANLTADLLEGLAPALPSRLLPGGMVIASGIAEPRAGEVRQAFARAGLMVSSEEAAEEWRALVARRAVATAIDRGQLAAAGDNSVATGVDPQPCMAHNPSARLHPHKPQQAKELLGQSGLKLDEVGELGLWCCPC
jgi:ribosomal protein L11 methyltransferase